MGQNRDYGQDVYMRLFSIISLLQEVELGWSIHELAGQLGVPEEIIREDLKFLVKEEDQAFDIQQPEQIDITQTEKKTEDFVKEIEELDEQFSNKILNGELDDEKFILFSKKYQPKNDKISMQLTYKEVQILEDFLHQCQVKVLSKKSIDVRKKKIYDNLTSELVKNLLSIQYAISENKKISFMYLTKDNQILKRVITPIKIVKFIAQELVYLISIENSMTVHYRLDRMKEIKITRECGDLNKEQKEKIEYEFDLRWGMGQQEEPFKFEMEVYNEANLPERLQKELQYRKLGKWSVKDNNIFVYEDMVIGYHALKNWILSLGSSVKVIKPEKLANDIKISAQKRVEQYEELLAKRGIL